MNTQLEKLMASIHNRFDIEVIDATSGEVKQKAKAENVICTGMWTGIMSRANYFSQVWYGRGSGVPTPNDTALFSLIDRSSLGNFVNSGLNINTGVYSSTGSVTLSETQYVGETFTELGIGYYPSSTYTLCSHAMITDMNGNQISIHKTSTDILNIYATIYLHVPQEMIWVAEEELTGPDFKFFPMNYFLLGVIGRSPSYGDASWPGTDLVYTKSITGIGGHKSSGASAVLTGRSFVADSTNKKWKYTAGRIGASSGNFGFQGFEGCDCYDSSIWGHDHMTEFYGKLPGGYQVRGEAVGTGDGSTVNFATKFEFPYNATVYVDGVAQTSGVTVTKAPGANYTNMEWYMFCITANSKPGKLRPTFSAPQVSGTENLIFYNPWWELGLTSMYVRGALSCSNDLENWVDIRTSTSTTATTYTIPSAYRNYKYWKKVGYYEYNAMKASCGAYNIKFDNPPAEGSVITIDYMTDFVPKDENHVFDFSFSVQLGEYAGEGV